MSAGGFTSARLFDVPPDSDFAIGAPPRALAAGRSGVAYVAADTPDRLGLASLLVRPDGIVAWASDDAADIDGAEVAAARWFGAPVHAGIAAETANV